MVDRTAMPVRPTTAAGFSLLLSRWHWAVMLIPLAFLIWAWLGSNGVPYFTDNNESFSAYVHARNMLWFDPLANAFLTDDSVAFHPGAHPFTYTHQGNLPRYLSAVMLLLGITSIEWQILIAGVVSILLAVWFARHVGAHFGLTTAAVVFGLLMATDFLGNLQWYTNLFRTWHLPLFFGCLVCTRWRGAYSLAFVCFFLLWQMEFVFAVFTTVTALGILLLTVREPKTWPMAATICTAIGLSLLIFIAQLILFLGWDGFLFDLRTTYLARNSTVVQWEEIAHFYETRHIVMWPSFKDNNSGFGRFLYVSHTYGAMMYGKPLWVLGLLGTVLNGLIVTGAFLRPDWFTSIRVLAVLSEVNARVGLLLWPMLAGLAFLAYGVSGYTMSGYIQRWGPMLGFPLSVALIGIVVNGAALIVLAWESLPTLVKPRITVDRNRVAAVLALPIVLLWIGNSIQGLASHPLFVHLPAQILATKYRNATFVSNTTYPHMVAHFTGNWSYYSPLLFGPNEKLDQTYNWNADRFVNLDYRRPQYYLCQRLPYRQDVDCDKIAEQMAALGHKIDERGAGWSIVKLNMRSLENHPQ
ncbi:hypothetical protein SAE02_71280 [Skermanella aerolata]|uniref:Glycosyltransferase RgtA/B/C/D-like domain-containing protein n=1 Tax=Skermanella aerolata TaxID=393310 RepID=A0A512E3D3_9PROT|nr:hypothetical protein [Skermanella aerolata]KJB90257.1 hypothetical protein N826_36825 [Skermanella aerolata KACC 11604]GEO42980.1 hypothetical protein SAE02_71280 [Skermanella aerolata]